MDNIITPLYKFIIFLEDKGSVNAREIDFIDRKSLRGVMGKMEAMGLIQKSDDRIKLSDNGYRFLNTILDAIHNPTLHWDGKWRIIYFTTPEDIRSRRDKFRREIEGYGFRAVIKGLWFSPLQSRSFFDKVVKTNNLESMSLYLEIEKAEGVTAEMISSAWEFDKHRKNYEEFIARSEQFIKQGNKNALAIKELIFSYAVIVNSEPRLPIELLPGDWPKYRAKLMYKRLKNLIL